MDVQGKADTNPLEDLILQVKEEHYQSKEFLREVSQRVEQSQGELARLTQRNAVISGHLQQIQAQFENVTKSEILKAYNASLDSQQRMLVMRSQLEKLQSEQSGLQKLVTNLELMQSVIGPEGGFHGSNSNGAAVLETVINSQEAVRQRLSRQMHDGPAQTLSNFIVQTEIAARLFDLDPKRAREELDNLKLVAMQTFQKMRSFIFELRPMMLDDLGLFPTLKRYVDSFKEQSTADVNLEIKGQERRLEPYLEVMIFRAVQELMGNAERHNMDQPMKIQIQVKVALEDNMITISASDNGKGFDPASLPECDGLGLKLIRERVDMLGGYMEIDSAIGQGCKVSFQIPALEVERV